jgi:hypothetical protein
MEKSEKDCLKREKEFKELEEVLLVVKKDID